LSIGFHLWLV